MRSPRQSCKTEAPRMNNDGILTFRCWRKKEKEKGVSKSSWKIGKKLGVCSIIKAKQNRMFKKKENSQFGKMVSLVTEGLKATVGAGHP